jgi:hypothetical protein
MDRLRTIRRRGCHALGIAGGLEGENAREDLGVLRESERRVGLQKRGLSYVGDGRNRRRVGNKGIEKEKDYLLQMLGVDIHCGTYGGGPHRCSRRMQSAMDGEGASGMEGAYGALL